MRSRRQQRLKEKKRIRARNRVKSRKVKQLPLLPLEIQFQVIYWVYVLGVVSGYWVWKQRTLAACCLTCHAWHSHALPFLYRHVYLSALFPQQASQLGKTYICHKTSSTYLKSLVVHFPVAEQKKVYTKSWSMPLFPTRFNNITHLEMQYLDLVWVHLDFFRGLALLPIYYLRLNEARFSIKQLQRILHSCSKLQHLILYGIHISSKIPSIATTNADRKQLRPSLKSLQLSESDLSLLQWLFDSGYIFGLEVLHIQLYYKDQLRTEHLSAINSFLSSSRSSLLKCHINLPENAEAIYLGHNSCLQYLSLNAHRQRLLFVKELLLTVNSEMSVTVDLFWPSSDKEDCKVLESSLLSIKAASLKLVSLSEAEQYINWFWLFPRLAEKGILHVRDEYWNLCHIDRSSGL